MSKLSQYIKCPNCKKKILFINSKDFTECNYCKLTIFKNNRIKFKYQLRKKLENEI